MSTNAPSPRLDVVGNVLYHVGRTSLWHPGFSKNTSAHGIRYLRTKHPPNYNRIVEVYNVLDLCISFTHQWEI